MKGLEKKMDFVRLGRVRLEVSLNDTFQVIYCIAVFRHCLKN